MACCALTCALISNKRTPRGENKEERGDVPTQRGCKWSGGAEELAIEQAGMMAMASGIPAVDPGRRALAAAWPPTMGFDGAELAG